MNKKDKGNNPRGRHMAASFHTQNLYKNVRIKLRGCFAFRGSTAYNKTVKTL